MLSDGPSREPRNDMRMDEPKLVPIVEISEEEAFNAELEQAVKNLGIVPRYEIQEALLNTSSAYGLEIEPYLGSCDSLSALLIAWPGPPEEITDHKIQIDGSEVSSIDETSIYAGDGEKVAECFPVYAPSYNISNTVILAIVKKGFKGFEPIEGS